MIDLLLRGGAIGTILVTGIVLLSAPIARRHGVAVMVFGLLISCYLVASAPAASALPHNTIQVLILGATLVPPAFTWLILDLLTGPKIRRWPWMVLAAATVVVAFSVPLWPSAEDLRAGLLVVLCLGLMGIAVIADRDDLVDSRRRFRRGFLAVMTLLGVVISIVEATATTSALPDIIFPIQAGAFWCLSLLFTWQVLRPIAVLAQDHPIPAPVRSDLTDRLNDLMVQGAWRREGLSIRTLADKLSVPEHRLRVAINQELGFRNFSTFINGHRIEAAKAVLADPTQSRITILEIAYDTGFASLGPFNKAFRAQTGQSPREFRAQPSQPEQPGNSPSRTATSE